MFMERMPRHPLAVLLPVALAVLPACHPHGVKTGASTPPPDTTAVVEDIDGRAGVDPEPAEGDLDPASVLRRIHFDYDRAEIRPDAVPVLEANAHYLRRAPSVRVVIEGHCDERGSVEYNLALGERRARAALEYLARLGVARARLSVVSYGKEAPLVRGHDEGSWAENRRAEFTGLRAP